MASRTERFADWISNLLLVREDERPVAFYFLLVFLLIGWGNAIGRGTADALFLKRYGIEHLPLMFALLSPLLVMLSVLYAAKADRLPSEKLFLRIFQVLATLLMVSWLAMRADLTQDIYPLYYLLTEVSSELLAVHAALYLGHNFDIQQAKRLTAPIMAGTQIGTILGGITLAYLSGPLGAHNLVVLWLACLLLVMLMLTSWHGRHGRSPYYRPPLRDVHGVRHVASEVMQGMRLMRHSPLLKMSSIALFFMVIAFYVLTYAMHSVFNAEFDSEADLSAFYGQLGAVTSALALLLQLFVTGRIIRRYGVRTVNLYFPVSLVIVFSGLLVSMALPMALLGGLSRNTVMPAFRHPVRNLFFNALPDKVQGRARAMSLVVVMPLALLVAGVFLWFVQDGDGGQAVILLGLLATLAYLYSNVRMNGAYLSEIVSSLKSRLHLPQEHAVGQDGLLADRRMIDRMVEGIAHPDEQVSLAFAEAVMRLAPERGAPLVGRRLRGMSPAVRDRLLNSLVGQNATGFEELLHEQLTADDAHSRATALSLLCRMRAPRALEMLPGLLKDSNPRLRVTAVRAVSEAAMEALYPAATAAWLALLRAEDGNANIAALELADVGFVWTTQPGELAAAFHTTLERMIEGDHPRGRVRAFAALRYLHDISGARIRGWLEQALHDRLVDVRLCAVHCLGELDGNWVLAALRQALADSHPDIRAAAAQACFDGDVEEVAKALRDERRLAPHLRATLLRYLMELDTHAASLDELAVHWSLQAETLAGLAAALGDRLQTTQAGELLLTLLGERERDYIDLALEAVSPREGGEEVAAIKAALACGDRRHIASAREILQHFGNRELARRIDGLLGRLRETGAPERVGAWQQLERQAARSDDWFRACVDRVASEAKPA